MAKFYFYEKPNSRSIYILEKKSEDIPYSGLWDRCTCNKYSEIESYGPLRTVTEEEVLEHRDKWIYVDDEFADPYYIWNHNDEEPIPVGEPQDLSSCGTSLAALLEKSGF